MWNGLVCFLSLLCEPSLQLCSSGKRRVQWPTAVRGLRHAWKCGPWGRLGSLSVTPPPPPPPLAPLCSRLSRCPVRSGPAVKPCSVAGTAGVFQVTSLSQPPPLWGAHRSGFPSRSAAGPQEALLTQGSALSVSGHGRQGEGPEAYRQPRGGLHPSCPRSSLARTDLTACDPAVPAVGEAWTCRVALTRGTRTAPAVSVGSPTAVVQGPARGLLAPTLS